MAPGPTLVFVRVDVGDHVVLGSVEFRCEKSRSCLKNPVCSFQLTVFAAQTPPRSSSIVSLPEASESPRTEALSRYQARNVW